GVLGIAGRPDHARALARTLVAQLATLHAPQDLALALLTDADAAPDWEWMRWLPHCGSDDTGRPLAFVGNDASTREERVRELLQVLDARTNAGDPRNTFFTPAIVVVLDGARQLRALTGIP